MCNGKITLMIFCNFDKTLEISRHVTLNDEIQKYESERSIFSQIEHNEDI